MTLTNTDIKLRAARGALKSLINTFGPAVELMLPPESWPPEGWEEAIDAAKEAYEISDPEVDDDTN